MRQLINEDFVTNIIVETTLYTRSYTVLF